MIYLQLFWAFLQVGAFSFGGGMAALPLIAEQVVENNGWIDLTTFTDLITIAEMTPGPIAINAATFVGIQVAGFLGAIVATIGVIAIPTLVVSLLAYIYKRFKQLDIVKDVLASLRPAIVALIASAGISIVILAFWGVDGLTTKLNDINLIAILLFAASLFVLRKWKLNPIYVMVGCGIIGGIVYTVM